MLVCVQPSDNKCIIGVKSFLARSSRMSGCLLYSTKQTSKQPCMTRNIRNVGFIRTNYDYNIVRALTVRSSQGAMFGCLLLQLSS